MFFRSVTMKLIQYGLSSDPKEHAYVYLGNTENLRLATVEQNFPVNYHPEPTSVERDALDLLNRHGMDFLIENRPRVYVSILLHNLFLYFNGINIKVLIYILIIDITK